ncbi:bifunctional Zinc finger [Babesia duncani]|uniref:Bifunctional Zinc finger n=1 Tax=Babesia duncani TaxID=323732 RepID=A0AAD9PN08_9APIC|nr:bifunctional Zinc finger [Babesia duncani]
MEFREGDWYCANTTFVNFCNFLSFRCGYLNFSKRSECNRCGEKNDSAHCIKIDKCKGDKSSDWTCQGCGNLNWARRRSCNICKAPNSKLDSTLK